MHNGAKAGAMDEVRIFLIDDSLADAELMRLVAARSKLANKFVHFDNGADALVHLRNPAERLPELVLLDLNMPGMSGHDVLREIRQDPRLRRIAVVILTSSEDDRDVGQTYDNWANAYVVKPVGMDGFHAIVRAIDSFWFSIVRLPPMPDDAPGTAAGAATLV